MCITGEDAKLADLACRLTGPEPHEEVEESLLTDLAEVSFDDPLGRKPEIPDYMPNMKTDSLELLDQEERVRFEDEYFSQKEIR